MKFLLIAAPLLIGLIAAIATVAVGGMLISRTHRATRSLRLAAAPDAVWGVVTDFPAHPTWRTGVKSVEPGAPINGHPVWREVSNHGVLPLEVVQVEPPQRMVTRIADDSLPFGGTWTYELTPDGAGCRVRITEDGEIKPGAFRYIARLMGYHATLEQYLKALAKKMGESPQIES